MSNQRYMMRGVSASKEDVHNAIKNIDKGIFRKHSVKLFPIYWEVTRNIVTLCMPMVPEPNHLLLICTGKKRVTYPFGKVLHRMH